jgi:hypothetical protein
MIDEIGGNAYSVCVNGSSIALALKIDISDRRASVKTYFPIGQLQFQQSASKSVTRIIVITIFGKNMIPLTVLFLHRNYLVVA